MRVRPSKAPPARPAKSATEPARTLAQEKADFTAEGSQPPGQVGAGIAPALPEGGGVALPPETRSKGAATGRRQPPPPAGPVRRASKRNPGAWRGNG
jgi:hypothetical protein